MLNSIENKVQKNTNMPEVFIGERFKYKIFERKDLSIKDMYGDDCFFEDASKIIFEVVDFLPGGDGEENEYKLKFTYDKKIRLYKWYLEKEITYAVDNGLVINI